MRDEDWTPPQTLPEPDPRPGLAHKYVRISLMGKADETNMGAMRREGWEPVRAVDYPEIMHISDADSRFKDNIEIGGLVLCKAPETKVLQRRAYYAKQTKSQMEAVDNNFMNARDKKSNMTLFTDKKTSVSFGRGNT
jgi:hypothetical protein